MASYTLTNLISNGNFSTNSTSGWARDGNGTITRTAYLNKNCLQVSSSSRYGGAVYSFTGVANNVYYFSALMAKTNNTGLAGASIEYRSEPYSSYGRYETTKQLDSWTKISFTCPIASKTGVGVKIDTTRAANISTTIYLTDFVLINLTKHFGAGNEPSSAWCDRNISYFSSTTTVSADTFEISPDALQEGDVLEFYTTNKAETIQLPKGIYKFECLGAKGGSNAGNYADYGAGAPGGYSVGTIKLKDKLTKLFIYPGGAGYEANASYTATPGGFNGGGTAKYRAGCGGGASDIRIGTDSLYARVIVAGGGGGAQGRASTSYKASGGAGGGLSGQRGGYSGTLVGDTTNGGPGGTQTAGGGVVSSAQGNTAGSFGVGGNGGYRSSTYGGAGAGGGGWYGGGTGQYRYSGGGGGSGYVYTSETASNYPSGCLLNSNYYLTDAQTIAGTSSFPIRDGYEAVGNEAQGLVRITVIKLSKVPIRVKTTSNTWKEAVSAWVKINSTTWKELAGLFAITSNEDKYRRLEYIESSNSQYIDLNYYPNSNTRVTIDFELLESNGEKHIASARSNSTTPVFTLFQGTSKGIGTRYGSSDTQYISNTTSLGRYLIDKNKNSSKIKDGTAVTASTESFTVTSTLTLFARNNGSNRDAFIKGRLYSCQIYDNGELIRDLVPMLRITDNKPGLYDLVTDTFFTNAGTGNDFNYSLAPTGYQLLNSITSSGTQYINTGFKATNNTKMILDTELTYGSSWIMIAGSYDSNAYYSWWAKASQLYSYYASSNQNMVGPTKRTKLIADKNNWSYDTNTLSLTNTSFTATNPIYLFSVSNGGNYTNASMKLYSARIFGDNDYLERDYAPALRESDGAVGLYDLANATFYANAGTGTFSYENYLPPGYTALEYIESSGTQYINTGFNPKYNSRIILDISDLTSLDFIFGSRNTASATSPNQFNIFRNSSTTLRTDYFGTNKSLSISDTTPRTLIDKNANVTTMYGSTITNTAVTSGTCSYPLVLFALNSAGTISNYSSYKLHSCKIYDNGIIVRNFQPCINPNGEAGLYDTINSIFYDNAGTGTFGTPS